MKTWNFGIVGAGLIADFHAKAIASLPNAKLLGVYDTASQKARQFAQKHKIKAFAKYEDMLNESNLDIVTIGTPSGAHMEPAIAAAKAGKHVLCEKPLEVTLQRIDAMIKAHKKSGTTLGGIFQNRFCDALVPLREAINAGRFGVITYAGVYVPWWRTDEYYKNSWHGTWKLDGGGALMNQSIHMIDLLCFLCPPIESIQAFTATIGHPQIEAEDTAVAIARFAGGALGVIYGTTASYPGQYKRLEVTGTKGTVVYLEDSFPVWQFAEEKPQDKEIRERFGRLSTGGGGAADPGSIPAENHTRNFRAFIEALETGNEFSISAQQARKAVEIILSIYKSAKEQKIVHIK